MRRECAGTRLVFPPVEIIKMPRDSTFLQTFLRTEVALCGTAYNWDIMMHYT